MRIIEASQITDTIKEMCIEANHFLSEDMKTALCKAQEKDYFVNHCAERSRPVGFQSVRGSFGCGHFLVQWYG